jgi:lysophospholipase L1-like esterase
MVAAWTLVAGCHGDPPELRPLGPDAVVLAFGDSLTRGTGASSEESYPARLGRLLGRSVVNAGIPGEVSVEGVRRLPNALARHRPQLVILCHGGNDLLRGHDSGQVAENLRTMVRLSREAGAEVVLLGVPKPGVFLKPPGFYAEVAKEFGIPYEGEILKRILADPAVKADPIHPNGKGYGLLAEAVRGLLSRSGAVP